MIFCRGFFLLIIITSNSFAQNLITDQDWDFHFNIKDAKNIAFYDNSIYCFSANGLFSLDTKSNNILRNYNAMELNNFKVNAITQNSDYLILGLLNGEIVIYNSDNIDFINLDIYQEEIKINSLNIYNDTLYVSSSSGLFVISLKEKTILERYKNIGENGITLNITESLIVDGTIYLISSDGVYVFENNYKNPLDFRSWRKINFNLDNPKGILTYNDSIIFYSEKRIYNSNLDPIYFNRHIIIKKIKKINSEILVSYNDTINKDHIGYFVNSEIINVILPDKITEISDFVFADGSLWVAGSRFSLYNVNNDEFFSPNNTLDFTPENLFSLENEIYATRGNNFSVNLQNNGWENKSLDNFQNITSVAKFNNQLYLSSSTHGILNVNQSFIIDDSYENSLLLNESGQGIYVSDIESVENKLWILNYGSLSPLLSFDINNNWQFYNLQNSSPIYPVALKSRDEFLWIILDKDKGGGIVIYNFITEETFELNVNNGLLNTNTVNDIMIDKKGNVWVATQDGLIYFSSYNPNEFTNYIIPNDGNQFLFKGVKINTVEGDYSDKIWLGTDNGLYVFDSSQNTFTFQFNSSNSLLLSDTIRNIKFNQLGSAYINTSDGLVSVKTPFSKPNKDLSNLKVYPNPLKINENDRLYFNGLSEGSYIKITSLSGEKIVEIETEAGGFNWNLTSSKGIKINPGIYLIFLISEIGEEDLITKVLVL